MPNIGLLVPCRPPTPCDGRAQHYRRPGDPALQGIRTFSNGTTLTFGPNDPRHTFLPGDEFFEQIRVIEAAERDILAHRDRFFRGKENRSVVTSTPTSKDEKAAVVLSTANVYQSCGKPNFPGLAHPGFSTDTRGKLGFFHPSNRPKSPFSQQQRTAATPSGSGGGKKFRGRWRRQEDLTSFKLCPTPPPGLYSYWLYGGQNPHLNEYARYERTAENLIGILEEQMDIDLFSQREY